ncbi:MAG TPA: hypothetical protein VNQ73_01105 [Ilumatobacter sp.]|nr:hypothetical protein [Ilumatobacter sp.]
MSAFDLVHADAGCDGGGLFDGGAVFAQPAAGDGDLEVGGAAPRAGCAVGHSHWDQE